MPKIQKINIKNEISYEMIKKCKADIMKFGFSGKDYINFLISVRAVKDENTVLAYPNSDMDKYHKMFLEKNEVGDNDLMVLHNFKIITCDNNDNHYETGYFAPRSFWDQILDLRVDLQYTKNKNM